MVERGSMKGGEGVYEGWRRGSMKGGEGVHEGWRGGPVQCVYCEYTG